jgi:hypothetical protein
VTAAAAAALLATPAGSTSGWVTYRDDVRHFSISLPAFWLPAPQFLVSAEFGRFARRHPLIAREYRTLVRRARSRFPLLAFDASAKAFHDAAAVHGPSYGLFPAIFVTREWSAVLPVIYSEVVPVAWQYSPGPGKQGCFLDKKRTREISCGYFWQLLDGRRLFMGESQIQGKPAGRPWLIVGLAFAHTTHYVDAARDEPNRTYQAAWPTARYL